MMLSIEVAGLFGGQPRQSSARDLQLWQVFDVLQHLANAVRYVRLQHCKRAAQKNEHILQMHGIYKIRINQ